MKGAAATSTAVKEFFASNGAAIGDDVATRIALNFGKDGDRFTAVAEKMSAAKKSNWFDADGKILWPPSNGVVPGTEFQTILPVGTRLDRYGPIGKDTDFVAPAGTPLGQRALPPGSETRPLVRLEVIKPLPVEQSNVMPWFGQPGMGIQYQTTTGSTGLSIMDLIQMGYLKVIK